MTPLDTISILETAIDALCTQAPEFVAVVERTGTPPLRRTPGGFAGVLRIITGQQLSKASAAAIWQRMEERLAPLTPEHFTHVSEDDLRGVGQSRSKVRTIQALAEAVNSGALNLVTLGQYSDQQVAMQLTQVKGIGPWTAEIYLLSCLGRPDVWPAGDLALQVAAADISGVEGRLNVEEMQQIGAQWRPWRAVAARLLWAWYADMKGGVEPGVV